MRPRLVMISLGRGAIFSLVALSLSCCSTVKSALQAPVTAAPTPQSADQFQHALELLESGNARDADAVLHLIPKGASEYRSAAYVIEQIESPLSTLFPSDSFGVKVAKDGNLSSLARTYLGNSLAFFGLARYNGIPIPSKVGDGQTIRIPKTSEALQALNRLAAPVAAPPSSIVPAPAKLVDRHRSADEYFHRGLEAFQRQDLDAAIACWDKVLTIDPDYKNAQLNRAQAIRLKINLIKLQRK